MRKLLLLPVLQLICFFSIGQSTQLGVLFGETLIQGDYPSVRTKVGYKALFNPGFGLFVRQPIGDRFGLNGNFYFSSFRGDDALDPDRTVNHTPSSYTYPMLEISIRGDYGFLEIPIAQRNLQLYGLLGLGVVKITAGNNAIDENCPLLNAVIPMGLGIRSQITNNINVFLQAERVQGLNDCLDGLDVNNTAKDVYSMIKVGLSYGISGEGAGGGNNNLLDCPTFFRRRSY